MPRRTPELLPGLFGLAERLERGIASGEINRDRVIELRIRSREDPKRVHRMRGNPDQMLQLAAEMIRQDDPKRANELTGLRRKVKPKDQERQGTEETTDDQNDDRDS